MKWPTIKLDYDVPYTRSQRLPVAGFPLVPPIVVGLDVAWAVLSSSPRTPVANIVGARQTKEYELLQPRLRE
jgi:hypothetical protein